MTNEAMLKLINSYINENNIGYLNDLKLGLEENIREQTNKQRGNRNVAKAMNTIIKQAKKDGVRPALMGAWIDKENSALTVCDGYRAIQTWEEVELERIKDEEQQLRIASMIGDKTDYHKEAYLPTLSEVKTFIKLEKAKGVKTPYYMVDTETPGEQIAFNAAYLVTMLEAMPTRTGYYNSGVTAMYMEYEQTKGIVLPVRINR